MYKANDMKKLFFAALAAVAVCSCGASKKAVNVYRAPEAGNPVNIGYGSVDRDKLTYSVDQVEVDPKQAMTYTDIWEYMRGRVPGVEIGPSGPGVTPSIRIRGISSINMSTEPLIMLDGSEVSDISGLSPSDVASVSVLKDASASLYGVRGANGVILITTKSAKHAAEQEAAMEREARQAAKAARKARKEAKSK